MRWCCPRARAGWFGPSYCPAFTYIFLIRIIGPGQCVLWQLAQL